MLFFFPPLLSPQVFIMFQNVFLKLIFLDNNYLVTWERPERANQLKINSHYKDDACFTFAFQSQIYIWYFWVFCKKQQHYITFFIHSV